MMGGDTKLHRIGVLRTLGPSGSNCEAAALCWARKNCIDAEVVLHKTLEVALHKVLSESDSALLGCVVYPDLHNLVFPYLKEMRLADVFIHDTHRMVLAKRKGDYSIRLVATHPAPKSLLSKDVLVKLANSNSEAAFLCRIGSVDACITTSCAAIANGLEEIIDYGRIPMGFTIHVRNY